MRTRAFKKLFRLPLDSGFPAGPFTVFALFSLFVLGSASLLPAGWNQFPSVSAFYKRMKNLGRKRGRPGKKVTMASVDRDIDKLEGSISNLSRGRRRRAGGAGAAQVGADTSGHPARRSDR